ncbi:hypothetical protein SI65_09039 [Aspergillus cristatus]|uniref:Pyruvate carboxylase n=1 Tax=Aspergillus cristatus TaxID=573508 RepID=A0A1E3B4T4_ASPCR|nr:hypothetical protein SI65_09039 [Aspergillus cristatus]
MAPQRPIKRLLVANRGEIAVRIIQAARELSPSIETFALYTPDDRSHCQIGRPHHALEIPSAAAYLDIDLLVDLVKRHSIDAVHPGYGFLSESAEFAQRMWQDARAVVIGPGWETLARTGDKLQAKKLAEECGVPVLKALTTPTADLNEIRSFVKQVGFPVMIKAVDGGGGRGIRLVRSDRELDNAVDRAIGESPSRTVFVEKAAVDGFRHVEVQVVGDGTGNVRHLWERDCSIQRRFQKVVECAPVLSKNREVVSRVIDAALKIAKTIHYQSLGTFEFLVNDQRSEFYFLEINPRLQVEHTITESITGVDLVQTQLLLAQGHSLHQLGLDYVDLKDLPPRSFSIQLRLCAEDPNNNFSLGIGKITEFVVPSGHGIRVDTHINTGSSPLIVGSNFDNLLAKIIVTASSWEATVRKAQRILADTRIAGVTTNINLLRGIVAHGDFMAGAIDTQWLGSNLGQTLQLGETVSASLRKDSTLSSPASQAISMPSSNLLFRKGDAWSITLEPIQKGSSQKEQETRHHLQLSRVLRNEFPSSLTAEIEYTTPAQSATPYRMQLESTSTSASALVSSSHRRADPSNPAHIALPLSGKLIEVLVSEGDHIAKDQVVAFVKQMKMELEVRSPRAGMVKWAFEMEEDEEDVAEGILLAELEEAERGPVDVRGKL